MAIVGEAPKQPGEVQDYDIRFVTYLARMADTVESISVSADPGITVDGSSETDGVVKVWLSGGTHGANYKVTARITTVGGRVKEDEIKIQVRET